MSTHVPPHNKQNRLLIRDVVGKVRSSNFDLPEEEFIYGRVVKRDKEGARDVVLTWKQSKPSTAAEGAVSFVKMNKLATQKGLTNSKQVKEFRKTIDCRVTKTKGQRGVRNTAPKTDDGEEVIFGLKSQKSTPLGEILTGHSMARDKSYPSLKFKDTKKGRMPEPRMTRSFNLNKEAVQHKNVVEDKPLYKIKKFQKVGPRVAMPHPEC